MDVGLGCTVRLGTGVAVGAGVDVDSAVGLGAVVGCCCGVGVEVGIAGESSPQAPTATATIAAAVSHKAKIDVFGRKKRLTRDWT